MKIFYSFCFKFTCLLAGLLLLFFSVETALHPVHLVYIEHAVFNDNSIVFFIILAIIVTVLCLLKNVIKNIPSHVLYIVLAAIYIILGLYLVLRAPAEIRDDPRIILESAINLKSGNFDSLSVGSYLRIYPFQLGMVTFEIVVLSIIDSVRILFALNLVFVLLINILQWKITDALFKNKAVTNWSILFSFGFAPMLFYILFVYGTIPGFLFVSLGYYFLIKYLSKSRIIYDVLCGICLGISMIFKPNYAIAIIACIIVLLLDIIKRCSKAKLLVLIAVLILSIVPNKLFLQTWRNISGVDFDGGSPVILHVVMGLQPEEMGTGRIGGWYNGYNLYTFTDSGYDVETAKQMGYQGLKDISEYWKTHKKAFLRFVYDKVRSTWCDPLFQSIQSGPSQDYEQEVTDPLLNRLFNGGTISVLVEKYMNYLMVILYALAALWCLFRVRNDQQDTATLFFILLFLGGFTFHLISETKSQYVFMYAYGLIPYAAKAFCFHKD